MKKFIQKITEKPLWVNILAGLGIILILIILFFSLLGWITGYGNITKVPSVTGQEVTAATQLLEQAGFEVEIQDSVYVDSIPKLAVVRQTPEADASVKTGRTIYLTVNRMVPPQVEMPSLIGYSVKSAELYLQSLQLKMGTVTYKPDIARNSVLEQLYNGVTVKEGDKVPLGATISFVLGSGLGGNEMDVPNLIGMTLSEARSYLSSMSINVGAVVALGAIRDSATAFVVRQSPEYLSDMLDEAGSRTPNKIRQGQLMDIYISSIAPIRDTGRIIPPPNQN
ncbi:PASTA domain-containing protein [Sediminibacterium sp.]|uniref:PASTA domain-containing protein n=1 Tax=Sediminibacterium sp. TaxID=1917865 RepID=UPI0025EEF22D|nr:PASTA domain-containing protein [Sediminibacterium sp.]MBW0177992.1 PASTA domain-containing protein [Sediminibacterium sp.]